MKRLVLLSCLALTSCSVLFDPSKVPLLTDAGQPPPPDAGCDPNEDPIPPEGVTAVVRGQSGTLGVEWARAGSKARYRVCITAPGNLPVCSEVTCTTPLCSTERTGLADGVKVTVGVAAITSCGDDGPESETVAVPFDRTNPSAWAPEVNACGADFVFTAGPEAVALTSNSGFCNAAFSVPGTYQDVTIDAELLNEGTDSSLSSGVLFNADPLSKYRLRTLSGVGALLKDSAALSERVGTSERPVALGTWEPQLSQWRSVRVIVSGNVVTWLEGNDPGSLREIARWVDPRAHDGQVGLAMVGKGKVQLRAFAVRTSATLTVDPDAGAAYALSNFTTIPHARPYGRLTTARCIDALLDCDAGPGCKPPAGDICLVALGYQNLDLSGGIVLAPPANLDPSRAWELSVRFAVLPEDAGLTQQVLGLENQPLIEFDAVGVSKIAGTPTVQPLNAYTWHDVSLTFPSDAGLIQAVVDGQPMTTTTPWPPVDRGRTFAPIFLSYPLNAGSSLVHRLEMRQR